MREGAIYREDWPVSAVLYAGKHSPPAVGARVTVRNFYDGTERVGTVTAYLPGNEYEV